MVWSLSKDDDGLDSVLPAADAPQQVAPSYPAAPSYPVARSQRPPAPAPPRPPSLPGVAPTTPSVVPSGSSSLFEGKTPVSPSVAPPLQDTAESPSVVVDPVSQIPEALATAKKQKGIESTEILKGRRLDALRAEVAQRRKAAVRRQRMSLILWGLAGAGALCLGWLVGRMFTPSDEAEAASGEEIPAADSAPGENAADEMRHISADEVIAKEDKAADPDAAAVDRDVPVERTPAAPVTTLDELPEDAPAHPEDKKPAASSGDGETLTLDDLPLE